MVDDTKGDASPAPKSKSGDKRQPRLQDVQRLEEKVAALEAEVRVAREAMNAAVEKMGQNPFLGLTFDDVFAGVMYAMSAANTSVKLGAKAIHQRGQTLLKAFRVFRGDEEGEWVTEARERRRAEAELKAAQGARETRIKEKREGIEPVEREGPSIQILGGTAAPLIPTE